MDQGYNASDIKVLKGLEAVRMRPGMYIGTTESRGLHHLLWEIVDNAIDEAANGFADTIGINLFPDGSVSVTDNGRGIPVDMHPELHISGVEVVFTQLHAGGKFSSKQYQYAGGLHGVGASVVNALSRRLLVEVGLNGILYRQEYQSVFDENTGKIIAGKPVTELENLGRTRKRGTTVTFWPDDRVFETLEFQYDLIARRIRELSYLNSNVTLTLSDQRKKQADGTFASVSFCSTGGLIDFVRQLNSDRDALFDTPILLEGRVDRILVSIAIQYNDGYNESILSFVNNIPTIDGGMHETGFKTAFTKCMNDYTKKSGLGDKQSAMSGEDFREGMTAIISLKLPNPLFEGQTKTRLGNAEARTAVETVVNDTLSLYLEDLRNQKIIGIMLDKAVQAQKAREAARKAKSMARERSKLDSAPLVGKLSSCTGRNYEQNELFIVEGDSAGGSAKQGRDRSFQAILPLRGKPLNSEKKRLEQVLANEEFRTIIAALGTGIDEDFNIKNLKYHRIIILSDADQDGAHIRAILATFFYRYMKELMINGHIYIGMPPLYRIQKGKTSEYVYDDAALMKLTKQYGSNYTIQRYKGLGEMNPEQLWETTMDPAKRTLVQISIEDAMEAERLITVMMGDKPEPRKEYIFQHTNFDKEDKFEQFGGEKFGD